MPKFSILIPTFKASFLEECLNSVLEQTYNDFEIIVVNDNSPENIDSIVEKFQNPRLRYYRNTSSYGSYNLVNNWNHCLELAFGDYVICMGDDDKLTSTCLEEYSKLIESYPEAQVLHVRTEVINEKSESIFICESHKEIESICEFMYGTFIARNKYFIGDFCFQKKSLTNGFAFFPHAWHSDRITVFQQAVKNGIVFTNHIGFQYRVNQQSISSTPHVQDKIEATKSAESWYLNFFETYNPKEDEVVFFNLAKKQLKSYIFENISYMLQQGMESNLFKVIPFFFKRKKFHISFRCFITAFFKAIIVRLYKFFRHS